MEDQVILVNEKDEQTGALGKMEAHEKGLLHRAFSVFIFNQQGEMLLQQRALTKYHSAGLWTNSCCSHPRPGESTDQAASRRLSEELGFTTPVRKVFDFMYRADFENGLIEHEFDHVYVGEFDGMINFNPEEVLSITYKKMPDIESEMIAAPEQYTRWFQLCFPMIGAWWEKNYKKGIV